MILIFVFFELLLKMSLALISGYEHLPDTCAVEIWIQIWQMIFSYMKG